MSDLITRSVTIDRDATDTGAREIVGMAVPFDTPTEIVPGLMEQFAAGAITTDDQPPKLFWQHETAIGLISAIEDRDGGAWITARISETAQGDEALTLIRDGVLDRLSVGFLPVTTTEETTPDGVEIITRNTVILREVSVVDWPAYTDAKITETRQGNPATPNPESDTMPDDTDPATITRDDLEGMATRADVETLARQIATLGVAADPAPARDTRTAAEVLKALVAGDTDTRTMVGKYATRAYTGGVVADDGAADAPAFVADLTRIVDDADPIAKLFGTAPLPPERMSIEFSRLKANTVKVAKQAAEGDTLAFGKVEVETDTNPIATYGGWTQLSAQEVQRTSTNMLNLTLNAMAIEAGKGKAADFAAFYEGVVKAQTGSAIKTTKAAASLAWADLFDIISDATDAYTDLGVPCTGLIVDTATFKGLGSLTGADGRPLMQVATGGTNVVGTIAPAALGGDLAGITVVKNARQTAAAGAAGAFFNTDALRTYSTGVAQLSDSDITNLTNAYSVYYLAAFADEMPGHIIPLILGGTAA